MKIYSIIIVFLVSVNFSGCKPKSSLATLQCKKIETYESDAGWLNLNGSELGHVLAIDTNDPKNMTGVYVGELILKEEDFATPGKKIPEKKLNLEVQYEINFTGDISPKKMTTPEDQKKLSALETEIKNIAKKEAHLVLKNSQEQRLRLPLQTIKNADDDFQKTLKDYADDPEVDYVFYVVSALTTADHFTINQGNIDSLANNTTIGKIANLKLTVNNQCNASIDIDGGAPFFKPSFFNIIDDAIKPAKSIPLNKVKKGLTLSK